VAAVAKPSNDSEIAVHEMTMKAKLIISAYYGWAPKFSYWNGCSTGGRQALAEAQRVPADYDGIVAGAPALFLTHMQAASVWKAQAIRKNPGGFVPPSKLLLIHNAVLAACAARDGVKDGLLEDPRLCDSTRRPCSATARKVRTA
jgi:feruloyl esterase